MSERMTAVDLYQKNRNYDMHRLQINRIKTKSSPVMRKKKQQDSILESRHFHQSYNTKFRHKQNLDSIQKKNNQIITKMLSLSKIKRPNSHSHSQIINRMESSRIGNKRETMRSVDLENQRFVKKLVTVKSTISNFKQSNSFHEHRARSQMLSKFKVNTLSGSKVPKNYGCVQKRLKLEPIHKKLQLSKSKQSKKSIQPIKFNSQKLSKMKLSLNPQLAKSIPIKSMPVHMP